MKKFTTEITEFHGLNTELFRENSVPIRDARG